MANTDADVPGIEERKVRIEEGKLENERSFARRWFPTIATLTIGLATLAISGGQAFVAYQDRQKAAEGAAAAAAAEKQRQDAAWGQNVLELYVKYPDQFDPTKVSPEAAGSNLSALVLVAPGLMQPILQSRKDALVRATQATAGTQPDPTAPQANDTTLATIAAAAKQAESLAPTSAVPPPVTSPSLPEWPADVKTSDYTIYIQYGDGSNAAAAALADKLKANGFRVPGLDQVASAPSVPQVRYYRKGQDALASALAAAIGANATTSFIGATRKLPDGIIEVWLPKST